MAVGNTLALGSAGIGIVVPEDLANAFTTASIGQPMLAQCGSFTITLTHAFNTDNEKGWFYVHLGKMNTSDFAGKVDVNLVPQSGIAFRGGPTPLVVGKVGLLMENEPNSDKDILNFNKNKVYANIIPLGDTIQGRINQTEDDFGDWFYFTVPINTEGELHIDATMRGNCSSCKLECCLIDPDGNQIKYLDLVDGAGSSDQVYKLSYNSVKPFIYYLRTIVSCSNFESHGGTYTLHPYINREEHPTSVVLDQTTLTILLGDNAKQLVATVIPEYISNKDLVWSSSNTSVATVDNNGKVTAVGEGMAVITVTTAEGGKTAECRITVTDEPVIPPDSYKWETQSQVPVNEIWDITFSQELNSSTVNNRNIYVSQDQNAITGIQGVAAIIDPNNSQIAHVIPPKEGWAKGQTYYLFIKQGVKNVKNKSLSKAIRMEFNVMNDNEVF